MVSVRKYTLFFTEKVFDRLFPGFCILLLIFVYESIMVLLMFFLD